VTCPRLEALEDLLLAAPRDALPADAEAHLEACAECRRHLAETRRLALWLAPTAAELDAPEVAEAVLARLDAEEPSGAELAALLAPTAAELDAPDLAARVIARVDAGETADLAAPELPRLSRARWRLGLGVALAASLAGAGLWRLGDDGAGLAPRGAAALDADRWVSLEIARARGDALEPVLGPIAPGDHLAFAVRNPPASPHRYVAIVAVDAAGSLHWYYPGEGGARTSVAIATTAERQVLPEVVRRPLAVGPLRVIALFSPGPLEVTRIERALGIGAAQRLDPSRIARVALAGVGQHHLDLDVREVTR
jgi:hypothetical protein